MAGRGAELEIIVKVVDQASAALVHVGRQSSGLGGILHGALAVAGGNAITSLVGHLGGLGSSVLHAGFGFDSMKQQALIAFETMLGSADAARAHLGELQSLAARTPFETSDLIRFSQRLQAMGTDASRVAPMLTSIGNAVAGLGGNAAMMDRVVTALGQIQAKGKASAEELMQLTEAGIPAWQMLADKIGVSIPAAMKMVEKGAVDSHTTIDALMTGMDSKFSGLMEKQSHTAAGLLSTLKDTFSQTAGQVMQPFFEMATHGMERLAQATAKPEFQQGVQRITAGLASAVQQASAFATEFGPPVLKALGDVVGFAQEHWPQVHDAIAATVEFVVEHWPQVVAAFERTRDVVVPIVQEVFGFLREQAQGVMDFFDTEWPHIQEAVTHVIDAIVVIATGLWRRFGDDLVRIVRVAWDQVMGVIEGQIHMIEGLIQLVVRLINGDWAGAWDAAKLIAQGAWETIHAIIEGEIRLIVILLKGLGQAGLDAGQALVSGIWQGIQSMGGWLRDRITEWAKDQIPGWARHALGIDSPSRVMADLVGRPITEGVAVGMLEGLPSVVAAASAVAAAVVAGAGMANAPDSAFTPGTPVNLGGNVPVSPLDLVSIQAMSDAFLGSLGYAGTGTGGAMFRDVELGAYTGKPTQSALNSIAIRQRAEEFSAALMEAFTMGADQFEDAVAKAVRNRARAGGFSGVFAPAS